MQNSTTSNTEISRNTNMNNYNHKIMWKRMMSNDNVSTTLFMTKHDQKSFINKWENRMRTVYTILK